MKGLLITVCLTLAIITTSSAEVIVLEGNYQGKNLYVQNPFAGSGVGFCAIKVTVNGDVTTDEINSSAFEIDFTNFQLEIGAEVIVKIEHKSDCHPKVLNPEVLKPKSTYEIGTINVDCSGGVLKWTTKGETGKLPFIIEQYRWNKWIKIGEVDGIGTPEEHAYEFNVGNHLHSGENKFRVKQVDYTNKPKPSKAATCTSTIPEIDFKPKVVRDEVIFTGKTLFEIYDAYGNIVKKGFGDKIDCANLTKGAYYLNFDNRNEKFLKK
jgi:hypothetical protein